MEIGIFLYGSCAAFLAVTFCVPLVSWLFLRGGRRRLAATPRPAPLTSVFFTEVLLWVAGACVAGTVLALLLGVVVLANSHAAGGMVVRSEVTVPWSAVALVGGLLAVLSAFGYWLHGFTARKLLPASSVPQGALSPKDE